MCSRSRSGAPSMMKLRNSGPNPNCGTSGEHERAVSQPDRFTSTCIHSGTVKQDPYNNEEKVLESRVLPQIE